jgi:hypothetical protein
MSLVKAGLDVSLSYVGVPGVGSVVELIDALLDPDPGSNRKLDAAFREYVLSELPRLRHLLLERMDRIAASGCTPLEAQAITYQVIEEQKRTLDPDKRRRLTNVLVNGLQEEGWDKVKHRLLVRLASEIEGEHIFVLNNFMNGLLARKPIPTDLPEDERRRREATWREIFPVLVRELVARGLIIETTDSKIKESPYPRPGRTAGDPKLEVKQKTELSHLAGDLLKMLRDPEDGPTEPDGAQG